MIGSVPHRSTARRIPAGCFGLWNSWVPLIWLALSLGASSLHAEKYLSVEEAQKLMFPEADHFAVTTHRFSNQEKKEIEKLSGQKVRNPAQRFWVARKGETVQGLVILDFVMGKHEVIDYCLSLDSEGKVRQIEILEYRESHGREIRGEKWRAQFKGKGQGDKIKLNEDIYNISGATISCRSITEGVRRCVAAHQVVFRHLVNRPAGPSSLPEPEK